MRQPPPNARGAYPRLVAQAILGRGHVDVPDARARLDAGGGAERVGGKAAVAAHHHLVHREVRMAPYGLVEQRPERHAGPDHEDGRDAGPDGRAESRVVANGERPATPVARAEQPVHQLPTNRTSGSSHTPLRSHTTRWARSIRPFTSPADSPPSLTKKFACRFEMRSHPMRDPFRLDTSICPTTVCRA